MSIIYETTLSPSKYELLAAWLPTQPWFAGDTGQLAPVGAYRLVDPEGEVGFEGHLFTAGDSVIYHAPLSYRGAPLDEGDEFLVGTIEHGVLGKRWVSDAIGDPVFRAVLAAAIAQGSVGSQEYVVGGAPDGGTLERATSVRVAGTGSPGASVPELWAALVEQRSGATVAHTEFAALEVRRVLRESDPPVEPRELTLRASWDDAHIGVLLAALQA
ncbi:maltokinase N-terminal cap-like domain-containing protein [Leucobacter sp. HY1910]